MPEEQKQETKALEQPGYYTTTRSKVTDFLLGFFGFPMLLSFGGLMLIGVRNPNLGTYALVGAALVTLAVSSYAVQKGRKYIAIGVVSSVILPFLVLGSCLLVISGGQFR